VVGVVTQPDRPAGRGRGVALSPVKQEALEEGIPVLQPERARGDEFLASWARWSRRSRWWWRTGRSCAPRCWICRPGIAEHPRLAPARAARRGADPVGDHPRPRDHGVSIMRMEAGLDSGPVLLQVEEPIGPDETGSELAGRLARSAPRRWSRRCSLLEGRRRDAAGPRPRHLRAQARAGDGPGGLDAPRGGGGALDPRPGRPPGAWSRWTASGPVKLFRPVAHARDADAAPGQVLAADAQDGIVVACGEGALRRPRGAAARQAPHGRGGVGARAVSRCTCAGRERGARRCSRWRRRWRPPLAKRGPG
jgi:methionyl-tRNA formyltransferase